MDILEAKFGGKPASKDEYYNRTTIKVTKKDQFVIRPQPADIDHIINEAHRRNSEDDFGTLYPEDETEDGHIINYLQPFNGNREPGIKAIEYLQDGAKISVALVYDDVFTVVELQEGGGYKLPHNIERELAYGSINAKQAEAAAAVSFPLSRDLAYRLVDEVKIARAVANQHLREASVTDRDLARTVAFFNFLVSEKKIWHERPAPTDIVPPGGDQKALLETQRYGLTV